MSNWRAAQVRYPGNRDPKALSKRYRLEGEAGLKPRSRRDEIVALRKELLDRGFDAGAKTISAHLARRHQSVP
jgi:hypothetical protein